MWYSRCQDPFPSSYMKPSREGRGEGEGQGDSATAGPTAIGLGGCQEVTDMGEAQWGDFSGGRARGG